MHERVPKDLRAAERAFARRPSMKRVFLALLLLGGCESCLKRTAVEEVTVHPAPSCDEPAEPELLAQGSLMSGPIHRERVIEHFRVEARGCLRAITVRQEWSRQITEVEAVFDDAWNPIQVWKRMSIPGVPEPEQYEDVRLYEFRNEPATMTERNAEGRTHRAFRGGQPNRLVGPGRALITAWIQRADLEVGETDRGMALDVRELFERVDEVALRRDADRYEDDLGREVRVYTVFGRESVFADENNIVIGDLAGLRLATDLGEAPEFRLPQEIVGP
ncbi:MAG: hypothetical protein AAF411_12615 [Myxococcota bacterium]